MRGKFLDFSLKKIKNNNPNYDNNRLMEIRYGLECFYITITKGIVIFSLALILKCFKETLLLLIVFNILRKTGFGMHAKSSGYCLLSSILIFLLLPMVAKIIIIHQHIKILLGALALIMIYLYAPADTEKRPIIKKKVRKKCQIRTLIRGFILINLMLIIDNNTISNIILFGIYIEIILILPITYKFFKMKYNNYLYYNKSLN